MTGDKGWMRGKSEIEGREKREAGKRKGREEKEMGEKSDAKVL